MYLSNLKLDVVGSLSAIESTNWTATIVQLTSSRKRETYKADSPWLVVFKFQLIEGPSGWSSDPRDYPTMRQFRESQQYYDKYT